MDELIQRTGEIQSISQIGGLTSDGYGKIQWLEGGSNFTGEHPRRWYIPKIRFRKGLPSELPNHVNELIR